MVKIYWDHKENGLSEETGRLTSLAKQSEGQKVKREMMLFLIYQK